jgi:hypothetical protein
VVRTEFSGQICGYDAGLTQSNAVNSEQRQLAKRRVCDYVTQSTDKMATTIIITTQIKNAIQIALQFTQKLVEIRLF